MTISTELLIHLAIGAVAALLAAKQLGWLRRPTGPKPVAPPPAQVYQAPSPSDSPAYETQTSIPLDISIKPRYNREP